METFIIVIMFLGTLAFLYLSDKQRNKTERDRFREFVMANKAENIKDYVEVLPSDEKLDIKVEDELIELDEMTPEELLKIRNSELK